MLGFVVVAGGDGFVVGGEVGVVCWPGGICTVTVSVTVTPGPVTVIVAASPCGPAGPEGPLGPGGPAIPGSPVAPARPRKPCGPLTPRGPRGPACPGTPRGPGTPGSPRGPRNPGLPGTPLITFTMLVTRRSSTVSLCSWPISRARRYPAASSNSKARMLSTGRAAARFIACCSRQVSGSRTPACRTSPRRPTVPDGHAS
jgi:hypothetical protein